MFFLPIGWNENTKKNFDRFDWFIRFFKAAAIWWWRFLLKGFFNDLIFGNIASIFLSKVCLFFFSKKIKNKFNFFQFFPIFPRNTILNKFLKRTQLCVTSLLLLYNFSIQMSFVFSNFQNEKGDKDDMIFTKLSLISVEKSVMERLVCRKPAHTSVSYWNTSLLILFPR